MFLKVFANSWTFWCSTISLDDIIVTCDKLYAEYGVVLVRKEHSRKFRMSWLECLGSWLWGGVELENVDWIFGRWLSKVVIVTVFLVFLREVSFFIFVLISWIILIFFVNLILHCHLSRVLFHNFLCLSTPELDISKVIF